MLNYNIYNKIILVFRNVILDKKHIIDIKYSSASCLNQMSIASCFKEEIDECFTC